MMVSASVAINVAFALAVLATVGVALAMPNLCRRDAARERGRPRRREIYLRIVVHDLLHRIVALCLSAFPRRHCSKPGRRPSGSFTDAGYENGILEASVIDILAKLCASVASKE